MDSIEILILAALGLYVLGKFQTVPASSTEQSKNNNITPNAPNVITNGGGGGIDTSGSSGTNFLESLWNDAGNAFDFLMSSQQQPTYRQQYPVPPSVINAGSNDVNYLPNFDWNSNQITFPEDYFYPVIDYTDSSPNPIVMPAGAYNISEFYVQNNNA